MDKKVNPFLSFAIMSQEEFKPIFKELFNSGDMFVYVYDNQIVATCIVKRLKHRSAHAATLSTLATHPDFHGKGIGTKFINQILHMLKESGIIRVDLLAEVDNQKAVRFYEKLGFEHEGIMKKYFRREIDHKFIDEHLMAKILD